MPQPNQEDKVELCGPSTTGSKKFPNPISEVWIPQKLVSDQDATGSQDLDKCEKGQAIAIVSEPEGKTKYQSCPLINLGSLVEEATRFETAPETKAIEAIQSPVSKEKTIEGSLHVYGVKSPNMREHSESNDEMKKDKKKESIGKEIKIVSKIEKMRTNKQRRSELKKYLEKIELDQIFDAPDMLPFMEWVKDLGYHKKMTFNVNEYLSIVIRKNEFDAHLDKIFSPF